MPDCRQREGSRLRLAGAFSSSLSPWPLNNSAPPATLLPSASASRSEAWSSRPQSPSDWELRIWPKNSLKIGCRKGHETAPRMIFDISEGVIQSNPPSQGFKVEFGESFSLPLRHPLTFALLTDCLLLAKVTKSRTVGTQMEQASGPLGGSAALRKIA